MGFSMTFHKSIKKISAYSSRSLEIMPGIGSVCNINFFQDFFFFSETKLLKFVHFLQHQKSNKFIIQWFQILNSTVNNNDNNKSPPPKKKKKEKKR